MRDHDSLPSLSALEEKIKSARKAQQDPSSGRHNGASHGMRAGLDLVSGVAVGTGIGYALDSWLGTMPLFLLICMMIGTAAGVKLLMETARRASERAAEEETQEESNRGR